MFIEVKNRIADSTELNVKFKYKIPLIDILYKYWQGSDSEFMNYMRENKVEFVAFKPNSVHELIQRANTNLNNMQSAFSKGNIGKFDFRIASAFKPKSLPNITENDFYKLTFDLSNYKDENLKENLKSIFFNAQTKSICDFKNINDDICELYYHKKGLVDNNDEIKLFNVRERVTLSENFKEPKDNNFICSAFILEMSKEMAKIGLLNERFSQFYMAGNVQKELARSVEEIIEFSLMDKEGKEAKLKEEAIIKQAKIEANEEIKKENSEMRQSLKADSIDMEILKENKAEIKLPNNVRDLEEMEKINANNIENLEENIQKNKEKVEKNIDYILSLSYKAYKEKERQKTEIRLEKAEKEAKNAYFDLKQNLEDNASILEAIAFIKQKYRNEDTINFASLLFAKDILNLKGKDEQIENLKTLIIEQDKKNSLIEEAVAKREKTIHELRSALTNKSNDLNSVKEEYEQDNIKFKEEVEKIFEKQKDMYEEELKKKDESLEEADEIIEELEKINKNYEILKEKNQILELNLKESENKIEKANLEIKFFNDKVKKFDELEKEYNQLKTQETTLRENNYKYESDIKVNEKLNVVLEERVKSYESQIENLMNLLKDKDKKINKNNLLDEKEIEKEYPRAIDILEDHDFNKPKKQ